MATFEIIWSVGWFAALVGLLVAATRVGRLNTASWLVVAGIFLLTVEEPLLTLWFALAESRTDPDGLADLVTPQALAHVFVASAWGVAAAALLVWIARSPMRRRERWSWMVLLIGLLLAGGAEVATSVQVFSRGLPLPTRGGEAGAAGFGWQPVAVGLLAWSVALVISYREVYREPRMK